MKPVTLALLACLVACESSPRGDLSSDIFEDIPAPRNAVYLHRNKESFSYTTTTFRTGSFRYEYEGSVDEVAGFYRETMTVPPYSWDLTGEDSAAAGSARLTFAKGDDICMVDIDSMPRRLQDRPNNLSIHIRVNYRR